MAILTGFVSQAQNKTLKVSRYLPADAKKYKQQTGLSYSYEDGGYGTTELIVHCETDRAHYEFVFTKKVRSRTRFTHYKEDRSVQESYNFKSRQWEYVEGSAKHTDMKSAVDTTYVNIGDYVLYAFVVLQEQGGRVEKAVFKDFGNEVFYPRFDYPLCSVSDEDRNGNPEFYLSYFAISDGNDDKEFKQLIYTAPAVSAQGKNFIKSKATAYYPVEDTGAVYRVEYDANWKRLSEAVKSRSRAILKQHRKHWDKK